MGKAKNKKREREADSKQHEKLSCQKFLSRTRGRFICLI